MADTADRSWLRVGRDVISAKGPEAAAFLQGQLSQDVESIQAGAHAWSWLLAPNGKVDALLRVTRLGPDEFLLDTDEGWGQAASTRLNRFKLRTKVEINVVDALVIGLRGEGWDPVGPEVAGLGPVAVAAPPWPGVPGADLIFVGRGPQEPSPEPGGREMDDADREAERIAAGVPRMGAELTEKTIPAETGLVDMTVSFTKGCYTGQELVARIDSRGGHVPRHLRRMRLAGPATAGSDLHDGEGSAVGTLTSVAASDRHGWVGLGYVKRGVEPPARLETAPGVEVQVLAGEK